MKESLAYDLLDQGERLGINSLKLNYRGESTMHPQFERITLYAKMSANGSTYIDRITNSNFNFPFEKESVFRGLCNQTKVKVSFDSFRKDIFEQQRKGSNYERTLANMHKFYNYPHRNNIFVVQAVRTQMNKDEDLEHEIKSRWPSAIASVRDCVADRVSNDLSGIIIKDRDYSERKSCLQAHNRLIVHANGNVVPCCPSINDDLVIGDANKETLSEIWKSKKAIQLRKDLLSKKAFETDPCKNCSSFETFKGFKPKWDS